MIQELSLDALRQIAHGLALQFGSNCEVVVHSLADSDIDHSIAIIENGHITGRKCGDGPSHVVLEALKQGDNVKDHLGYLTRTKDGKILKSSSIYLRDENGHLRYILAINFDIKATLNHRRGSDGERTGTHCTKCWRTARRAHRTINQTGWQTGCPHDQGGQNSRHSVFK